MTCQKDASLSASSNVTLPLRFDGGSTPALVLASSSPRRLTLLAQIGIVPAEIIAPDIDETPLPEEAARLYARRMARAKSAAVPAPGRFVLAADTVVAVGRRILPKAATEQEARACIDTLSGRRHRVLTAVVLTAPDGRWAERLSESVVAFARLTEAQKRAWLGLGEWEGKAGGYAINGAAAGFVRFLSGSFSGVVGLPLFETAQLFRGFGWPVP
jgi:septum formation protein